MEEEASVTPWTNTFSARKIIQYSICASILLVLLYLGLPRSGPYLHPLPLKISRDRQQPGIPLPCESLLYAVSLVGNGNDSRVFHSSGCELTNMTQRISRGYIKPGTHFVFMGDSRVRQLYCYFRYFWDNTLTFCESVQWDAQTHIKSLNIILDFKWRPYTQSMLGDFKKWASQKAGSVPDFILVGAGVWLMRNSTGTIEGEMEYRSNLTALKPYMIKVSKRTTLLWLPQDFIFRDQMTDEKTRVYYYTRLHGYNWAAREVLERERITIFWSAYLAARHFHAFRTDFIHFLPIADKYKTQILLNWICRTRRQRSPSDTSCCSIGTAPVR